MGNDLRRIPLARNAVNRRTTSRPDRLKGNQHPNKPVAFGIYCVNIDRRPR